MTKSQANPAATLARVETGLGPAIVRTMFFLSALAFQSQAHAWGDLGHEVVGDVAEQMINPQTKAFVRGILGVEPMVVSATWPDHARDDQRFGHVDRDPERHSHDDNDFAPFHICEIPTGFTYATSPMKSPKDCYGAITNSIELLKKATVSREEKMIALRYLIHVMGDIHQPLHVGNGYDRGANSCRIKWQEKPDGPAIAMNLHSFYDTTLVKFIGTSYADFSRKIPAAQYAGQFSQSLKGRYPNLFTSQNKTALGQVDVIAWLSEAQAARDSLYPDSPEAMATVPKGEEYKNRPYCNWYANQETEKEAENVIDKSKIPTLDAAYANKFKAMIENQLIKGGLRLAIVLDEIAAAQPDGSASIDDARQQQIIKSVQDALRNK